MLKLQSFPDAAAGIQTRASRVAPTWDLFGGRSTDLATPPWLTLKVEPRLEPIAWQLSDLKLLEIDPSISITSCSVINCLSS